MISPAVAFRPAVTDDAAALAVFAERVFRDTFGPHNRVEDMDAYCGGAFGLARQRHELLDPARHTILAYLGGVLVGYAQLRTAPPPSFVTGEAPIEILRFYIDGQWHGRGVAQALMTNVIDTARQRAARTLYLSVWDLNHRAIAFYARYGFAHVGSRDFKLGADLQVDYVMMRRLAP
jgi:ribosomal protein S18 acetylase RimI-like enzyme